MLANLQMYVDNELAPFPILADEQGQYYQKFAIPRSIAGMFKAMFAKRYFPSTIKGHVSTLPVDFLVNEQGVVESIYYGKDSSDHMPFVQVQRFACLGING